jgi:uncharacterized protein YcaQ
VTAAEASTIAVAAQLLHRHGRAPGTITEVLEHLGCVQIDSMTAVRRSHELVLLARGMQEPAVTALGTADQRGVSFEAWGHALSLVPMSLWPALSFRRRGIAANGWRGPAVDADAVRAVKNRLNESGRVSIGDFGKTAGSGWTRDSPFRWALEWLAATGEAVCAERKSWQRVYTLPDLVVPERLLRTELSDDECIAFLCRLALSALGVATITDIADYFRLTKKQAAQGVADIQAAGVEVDGWHAPAFTASTTVPAIDDSAVTALSPFDSLVWTRDRQRRLFGKDYRLEAYKPAAAREFGYFAMPVLWGARICGRIALRRQGRTLVIENQERDPDVPASVLGEAIEQVAAWTETKPTIAEEHSYAGTR